MTSTTRPARLFGPPKTQDGQFSIFSEYTYVMKAAADREKLAAISDYRRLGMWNGKPLRGTAGLKEMEIRAANDFFKLAERLLTRIETELLSDLDSTRRATLLDLKEKLEAQVAVLTLREG